MEFQDLKDKAKELLEPLEQRYYTSLSDVHWVTQDGHDVEGDYCENCIEKAVKNARKSLKEERQKVLAKFKEVEETGKFNGEQVKSKYTDTEIKKAKRYELKQLGVSKFSSTYNHGGGYESDNFLTCEICDKELNISILPNDQNLQYIIEDMEDGKIDDQTGYRAYWLLYNSWDEESERYKDEFELTVKLAKRVIEILDVVAVGS
jgi:hypothetical protein